MTERTRRDTYRRAMASEELPPLRFADCPATSASIDVDATPSAVWALVSDINLPARFSNEFQGAEWLDGAEPGVGARFSGRNHHPAIGSWETTCTVTEWTPERCVAYDVGGATGGVGATWRFTLEPTESGGTTLTQSMRMGPDRSGISPAIDAMPDKESKILHRRIGEHHANMTTTLEGIKALAEGRDR